MQINIPSFSPPLLFMNKPLALLGTFIFLCLSISSLEIISAARTYPEYCTTRDQQLQRRIPKLATDTPLARNLNAANIKHVTAIIRHGSRTPWARHQCWDGYNDPSTDTATWECKLTSMMRPQSEEAVSYESLLSGVSDQVTAESGRGLFFEFQKLYDANWSKKHPNHFPENMQNEFRGNCQQGQLIFEGYAQQQRNAEILKEAYFSKDFDEPDVGTLYNFEDEVQKTTVGGRAYDEPQLYFRSDDDERTMMSGQILIGKFFGELMEKHEKRYQLEGKGDDRPVIRVHTADRVKDVLAPNPTTCPRLQEIKQEAERSEGYREKFLFSDDAKLMRQLAANEFGGKSMMSDSEEAIDCVMTTVCEDKELPYVLDAGESDQDVINNYGKNIFDRFIQFNMEKEAFVFKYKNNLYSKISTNPLWNDILAGMLIFTKANEYQMHEAWPDLRPESKLALYSAHDSTIMSLLASLGSIVYDKADMWPPYASMVNIELFEISWKDDASTQIKEQFPTGMAFRLLYNGKILTSYVSGCMKNEELCDIDLLVLHVYPFSNVTEWDDQCKTVDHDDTPGDVGKPQIKDRDGSSVVLNILGGLFCVVIGAFTTYLYMMKFIVGRVDQTYDNSLAMTELHLENEQKTVLYGVSSRQENRDII